FISGCYTNDLDMIRASFEDVVIEPQRQALIPGFADVRRAAMEAGALGCSISGAGPAMFAWALDARAADVQLAMRAELARGEVPIDDWIVDIGTEGARVVDCA
ncbi:MAG: homoserine kinase, partial [Steroidobacteraceae bacterium]